MIAETSAFLTWALSSGVDLPRIPTRRVDEGGFGGRFRHAAARAAGFRWWARAIETIGTFRS